MFNIYKFVNFSYPFECIYFAKKMTHFGDALCEKLKKKIEYLIVLGVQLDNGVHPLGEEASKDVNM